MYNENKLQVTISKYFADSPVLKYSGGELHVIHVTLGGLNRRPDVSITGEIYEGKRAASSRCVMAGQCVDTIQRYHPDIIPLLKWHLWDIEGAMHYVANALYWLGWSGWWESKSGVTPPNPDIFKDHVNWGVLDSDGELPRHWLANHDPLLQNHPDGMAGDLSGYLRKYKCFASYLRPYIDEVKAEITTALEARRDAITAAMLADLETFFTAHGYQAGQATATMNMILR
jgi:hypothetical protein